MRRIALKVEIELLATMPNACWAKIDPSSTCIESRYPVIQSDPRAQALLARDNYYDHQVRLG